GEVTALSHRLYRSVLAWLVVALTITACGGFGRLTSTSEDPTASPAVEVGDALSVEAAVAALETDRDRLANGLVDLVAYVNAAPGPGRGRPRRGRRRGRRRLVPAGRAARAAGPPRPARRRGRGGARPRRRAPARAAAAVLRPPPPAHPRGEARHFAPLGEHWD